MLWLKVSDIKNVKEEVYGAHIAKFSKYYLF